jgi:hypothetical protein
VKRILRLFFAICACLIACQPAWGLRVSEFPTRPPTTDDYLPNLGTSAQFDNYKSTVGSILNLLESDIGIDIHQGNLPSSILPDDTPYGLDWETDPRPASKSALYPVIESLSTITDNYEPILTEADEAKADDESDAVAYKWAPQFVWRAVYSYLKTYFGYATALLAEPANEWVGQCAYFAGYSAGSAADPASMHDQGFDGSYWAYCVATGTPGTWRAFLKIDQGDASLLLSHIRAAVNYLFDATPDSDFLWQGSTAEYVAGEAISRGQIFYLKYNTDGPRAYKYSADSAATDNETYAPRGVAVSHEVSGVETWPLAAGNTFTAGIGHGVLRNDAWTFANAQDEGKRVFCSDTTAGGIQLARPSGSGDKIVHAGDLIDEDEVEFYFGSLQLVEVP